MSTPEGVQKCLTGLPLIFAMGSPCGGEGVGVGSGDGVGDDEGGDGGG